MVFDLRARDDFEKARRKSFWRSIASWFTQTPNDLLPFGEVRKHLPLAGQRDIGLLQIPLDKIIGSVGRYQEFDRAFLPRTAHTIGRWVSIDRAHLEDIILPPIEVYKVGDAYFVKDGNHRVSVARERGQVYIDAYVTEVDVPIPIGPDMKIDDLIRKKEQAWFIHKTGLNDLRPDSMIELTLSGGYNKLIEHIHVHRWFMGEERNAPVLWEEAVQSWYDEVYLPLVEGIREAKTLRQFPTRTEADLYLWVIEHLYYLREQYEDVTLKGAIEHFTGEYAEEPFARLLHLIRNTSQAIIGGDEEDGGGSN